MGTTHVRRLRAAPVTALACLLLLAGCGGDDPAPIVADPTPSPSGTPTPTASAAPQPWEERSKAGAVAFVEHWVEVLNESVASTGAAELAAISSPTCETCSGLISLIDGWRRDGTSVQTPGWEIQGVRIPNSQTRPPFDAAVRIKRPPEIVVRRDGARERYEGSTETYSVRLSWRRGGWSVETFNQLAS